MYTKKPKEEKTSKKKPEQQYHFKLWGLDVPLKEPLNIKDAKQIIFWVLIFLLVLAVFCKASILPVAAGISATKSAVGWIAGKFGGGQPRSP